MLFIATWMALEITTLSEVRKRKTNPCDITYRWTVKYDIYELIYESEIENQVSQYHLHVKSKKNDTNIFIYKTETDSPT